MINKEQILKQIKETVHATDPDAKVILYGSYARGDYNDESDIDLLILIDKEKVTREDRMRIGYPLYGLELKIGIIISPMIRAKQIWETKYSITPLYENINREGVML